MKILVILKEFLPAFLTGEKEDAHLCDSDKQILVEALHLRDKISGHVSVLAHGSMDHANILSEIWSYAPNQVFMLPINMEDRKEVCESCVNLLPIAHLLSHIIHQIGSFDLIFFGRQAVDGDSIHIASLVSHFLHLPLLPYTQEISLISQQELQAVCTDDNYFYTVKVPCPAVIVSINDKLQPRYPRIADIRKAYSGRCKTQFLSSFPVQDEENGDLTLTQEYLPEPKTDTNTVFLSGSDDKERAEKLLELLHSMGYCL